MTKVSALTGIRKQADDWRKTAGLTTEEMAALLDMKGRSGYQKWIREKDQELRGPRQKRLYDLLQRDPKTFSKEAYHAEQKANGTAPAVNDPALALAKLFETLAGELRDPAFDYSFKCSRVLSMLGDLSRVKKDLRVKFSEFAKSGKEG